MRRSGRGLLVTDLRAPHLQNAAGAPGLLGNSDRCVVDSNVIESTLNVFAALCAGHRLAHAGGPRPPEGKTATVSDPHALWLTLTNISLGLVMLGAGVALATSLFRRNKVSAATVPVRTAPAEESGATGP